MFQTCLDASSMVLHTAIALLSLLSAQFAIIPTTCPCNYGSPFSPILGIAIE
jgi:hypothetical protein